MSSQLNYQAAAMAREIDAHAAERRREARYPTEDPAEIEILPGPSEPAYGTVLDVSRSGLRIALRDRIGRGEQVMVKLHHNVIFGEVRYCRPVPGGFHLGLKIQDLVRAPGRQDEHIVDDQISLYAVGKGLSVAEVIEVREHLAQCEVCRACLAQREDMLNHGANHRGRLSIHPSD
jgi:PilZ domain/Putative zinc-finger